MKAKTGQFVMAISAMMLAGVVLLAQAQMTGGQARAAQAQATQTRGGAPVSAPAPAAAPQPAAAQAAPAALPAAPRVTAPRRDPFRPLIQPKRADAPPIRLPAGKPGLVIGQLVIQGIVRNIDGKWIAVVDNKTKRSYFLYERDELYNGVVTSITPDSVTFEERSQDAVGRTRTREVVKRIGG
jgi:hypothetical protein